MERLTQAEQECNEDSQNVNNQIHDILIDFRKKANTAMLNDISKMHQAFIKYGEKIWIELSKKVSLKNPLDFKYNILCITPAEWQGLSEQLDDGQDLGSNRHKLSAVIFAFASEQAKDKDT